MEKTLYLIQKSEQTQILVQTDDLKYDGKNIIIPSYWTETLTDLLNATKKEEISENDLEDYHLLVNFLRKISEHENSK